MSDIAVLNIRLVEAVNSAKTQREHELAEAKRQGFFAALEAGGWSEAGIGRLVMDGDTHYINRGVDRPMCGGVWLDWKPEVQS